MQSQLQILGSNTLSQQINEIAQQKFYSNGPSNLPAKFITAQNVWRPEVYSAMKNHFPLCHDNLL